MIEVDGHRHLGLVGEVLGHLDEGVTGVGKLVGVNREDDRSAFLLAGLHDALEHRIHGDVERGNREAVLVRNLQDVAH